LGQQQLLLIIVALIIVGIAIAVAMSIFNSNAIANKRDQLITECNYLASQAITYYRRPKSLDGGGHTFLEWEIPPELIETPNGYFEADVAEQTITITGTGNEVITGNDSIKVMVNVFPRTTSLTIIN
jgi:type II secretory pathway pseudopilin PulG